MLKHTLVLAIAVLVCGAAIGAQKPFDCKSKSRVPYTATISNVGTMNRAVSVTFKSKPSAADATAVVQACIKLAAAADAANDVVGSAWVGEDAVRLSQGSYYAYLTKTKSFKFM